MKELKIILPEESAESLAACAGLSLNKIVYQPSAESRRALGDVELHFDSRIMRISSSFKAVSQQMAGYFPSFEIEPITAGGLAGAVEKNVGKEVLDIFVITDSVEWGDDDGKSRLIYDNGIVLRLESGVAMIQRNAWFSDETVVYVGRDYTSCIIELGDVWKYDGRINPEYSRQVRSVFR